MVSESTIHRRSHNPRADLKQNKLLVLRYILASAISRSIRYCKPLQSWHFLFAISNTHSLVFYMCNIMHRNTEVHICQKYSLTHNAEPNVPVEMASLNKGV